MSNKYKALAEFIKELIRKEIAEASVTGNIDGGAGPPKTPYAFRNPKDDDKDDDDLKLSKGMKIAENYHQWKTDDTMSTKQKQGHSMREIRDRMSEIEKLVKYHSKLKKEMKFESNDYWKNTTKALNKISEKLVRLSTKIKDLI